MTNASQGAGAPAVRHPCICADDYGLSPAVNQAVLTLIEGGVVNATSCMVLREGWQAGIPALRQRPAQDTDIGLHLDLTNIDGSTREARLQPLILQSLVGSLRLSAMREQIETQLDRFEQALGRSPSHVDGHRHVHQLPVVREALLDTLSRRYPTQRPWVRNTRPGSRAPTLKQRLIHQLGGRDLPRLAERHGVPLSGALWGVYDFAGDEHHYAQLLAQWLRDADEGDVLMCHPARGAVANDAIQAARQREFSVLARLAPDLPTTRGPVQLRPHSRHFLAPMPSPRA